MPIAERPEGCLLLMAADNEELEYLGDSILGCIVATYLVRRYPGQGEGFHTRMRMRIVNNKKLGGLAHDVGLHKWAEKQGDYVLAQTILKESILDLYLLSACKYLYYQGNSSFSKIAVALKDNNENFCFDWLKE
jgi:dsRNA-specific ribonuclease